MQRTREDCRRVGRRNRCHEYELCIRTCHQTFVAAAEGQTDTRVGTAQRRADKVNERTGLQDPLVAGSIVDRRAYRVWKIGEGIGCDLRIAKRANAPIAKHLLHKAAIHRVKTVAS